jgi:hypothetical protein
MSNQKRYLPVELPEDEALVDFLSEGVSLEMKVRNGKLEIMARMSHGENASTWDIKEVSWDIPKKDGNG